MPDEYYYRFESISYSPGVDQFDNPLPGPGRLDVYLQKLRIIRRTPKGVWVDRTSHRFHGPRFILTDARKRFACPTIEEAKESFIARKKRHIRIMKRLISEAERALEVIGLKATREAPITLI
jgi:hypothetical protein